MDSSLLTKRRQNKVIANDFINRLNQPTTSYGPMLGISANSIINSVITGQMKDIQKCEGAFRVDNGCPCAGAHLAAESGTNGPVPLINQGFGQWITFMFKYADGSLFSSSDQVYINDMQTDSQNNINVVGNYFTSDPALNVAVQNKNGFTQTPSPIELPPTNGVFYGFMIQYNADGIAQWALPFPTTGSIGPNSISVDSNNNLYLTGSYATAGITLQNAAGNGYTPSAVTLPAPTSTDAIFVCKYSSTGQAQWATYFEGNTNLDSGITAKVDLANNIYLTGYYSANAAVPINNVSGPPTVSLPDTTGTFAGYLVKFSSAGQALWAIGIISSTVNGINIGIDSSNNVYLTGIYSGLQISLLNANGAPSGVSLPATTVTSYSYVIKYSTAGVVQWATHITPDIPATPPPTPQYVLYSRAITCDTTDGVYVLGVYKTPSQIMIYQSNGAGGQTPSNPPITLPDTTSTAPNTVQTVFIVKYNTSGQAQWATYLYTGTSLSTLQEGAGIVSDTFNNIYIVGQYISPINPQIFNASGTSQVNSGATLQQSSTDGAAYIIKYNAAGQVQWGTYLDSVGGADQAMALTIDTQNRITVGGQLFMDTLATYVQNANGNTVPPFQQQSLYNVPANSGSGVINGGFLLQYA